MEPDADDAVFRALSDPHRRSLLDALFVEDGQRLGQLCAVLPDMTRFGVMKHLTVLTEAELVVTAKEGRSKRLFLNPVPIEQVADRWISKYAARFTSALVGLSWTDRQHRYVRLNQRLAETNGAPVRAHLRRTVGERDAVPVLRCAIGIVIMHALLA